MKIYYISSEDFFKTRSTEFLRTYSDGREFKSLKRFTEYTIGRYLVKTAGEKIFNLSDTDIIVKDSKPEFKSGGLKFSITHSGKYIAAAFDEHECGLDMEEMKGRNLTALSKRYEREFNTPEDFYKFWTEYEAQIKLHGKVRDKFSAVFKNKYMLTVVSSAPFNQEVLILPFL